MVDETNFEGEIWKEIPEFEGFYEASTHGRIKSLDRVKFLKNNKEKVLVGKILSDVRSEWYGKVTLYMLDEKFQFNTHRLIAKTFIPNPDNLPEVNHKDGIKSNNHVDNLEWCTHKENSEHALINNLFKPKSGIESGNAKLTDVQVIEMRNLYYKGNMTLLELRDKYSIAYGAIYNIIKGRNWKHIPMPENIDINLSRKRVSKITFENSVDIKNKYLIECVKICDLAKEYGVKWNTIKAIIDGRTWKNAG
jgi:predicted DNA-binding protein YlxM (UPF0122 family)